MTPLTKPALRTHLRHLLQQMPANEHHAASLRIQNHLQHLLQCLPQGPLLGFWPLAQEPNWTDVWPTDRLVALPRVEGNCLRYTWTQAHEPRIPSAFGVEEPWADREVLASDHEKCERDEKEAVLILIPGLGFDLQGQRLGRGWGFYDRYLATLPSSILRIGIGFECQILPQIPTEIHDEPLHILITENRILPLHYALDL